MMMMMWKKYLKFLLWKFRETEQSDLQVRFPVFDNQLQYQHDKCDQDVQGAIAQVHDLLKESHS